MGSGPTATIKLFLPRGDAKSLRTAEISNWTGMAIAAPRTEMDELFQREELGKAGVYILSGTDPLSGLPRAYIGEAEVIRERLKQHKTKEFWVSAIAFVSKDENLTKAHVRYLESRLLSEAAQAGRFTLEQNQAGGSKLPESDRADMEIFLSHIGQLLPVLGSDLLIPVAQPAAKQQSGGLLFCRMKGSDDLSSSRMAHSPKRTGSISSPKIPNSPAPAPRQRSSRGAVPTVSLSGEQRTVVSSKKSTDRRRHPSRSPERARCAARRPQCQW